MTPPVWFAAFHFGQKFFSQHSVSANASLSRGFDFGPRGGPLVPVFRFPSIGGEWSAGRRPGACEAPLGRFARPACASCEDARAPAKSPAPPDAPSAARIVGGRTLLRHRSSR